MIGTCGSKKKSGSKLPHSNEVCYSVKYTKDYKKVKENLPLATSSHLCEIIEQTGARGGSRTHMRKNPRRILSPQRLPFRHPGTGSTNLANTDTYCNNPSAAPLPVYGAGESGWSTLSGADRCALALRMWLEGG